MKPGALPRMAWGFAADAAAMRARALRLEAAATRPWVLRVFAAVFTELLDAVFTELFDAVFTELLDALFTELFDAVFTELFADDLAATALSRDPVNRGGGAVHAESLALVHLTASEPCGYQARFGPGAGAAVDLSQSLPTETA
jgi:hypothetical protein